jgi:hypothetical protein
LGPEIALPEQRRGRRAAGPPGKHAQDHDDPLRVFRSPRVETDKVPAWDTGFLFVGEHGMLLVDYQKRVLLPEAKFAGYQPPKPSIPDSIGHYKEWVAACKTGSPTGCNFDYAGALTEMVLLGNVAFRAGTKLQWDAAHLRAANCAEADRFIRREYRKGWTL